MDTENKKLIEKLRQRLGKALPQLASHRKLAVSSRIRSIQNRNYQAPDNARQSAVLISIFNENGILKFPLILRNTYAGVHSNQIGLPGGKLEKGESHGEAALREYQEELGLSISEDKILGQLSSIYIPPSNFILEPFISYSESLSNFIPDPIEVAAVFLPSLDELMSSEIIEREIELNDSKLIVKCFILQNQVVWGATAAILSELKDVLKEILR